LESSALLRDLVSRLTRAREALEDAEVMLAEGIVEDLLRELADRLRIAERRERGDR
jgi:hypothetical protein